MESKQQNKKLFSKPVVMTILVLLGLVVTLWNVKEQKNTKSKAVQSAQLTFSTPSLTVGVLQDVPVSILIDSPTTAVAGVDVTVSYPADQLSVQSVQANTFLPVVLVPAQTTPGTTRIVLASLPGQAKSGAGILTTITFKTLVTGQATVAIDAKTKLALVGQTQNALAELSAMTLNISAQPTGRAQPPTQTPPPIPTATFSPTPPPARR